jgi:DNA end-binding protein Ku
MPLRTSGSGTAEGEAVDFDIGLLSLARLRLFNGQPAQLLRKALATPGKAAISHARLAEGKHDMAPRSFWKGYLKLSLVTCPVTMSPATTENAKVRFHTLNRTTGNRVVSQYLDSVSGKAVADKDEVKGYPRGEDDHVMLEDEEIEAVALDSTRTIDIEMFVPKESVDWIFYDKPHFLVPDDEVGEEAFSVIRDAMAETGKVGISRLVMYRRERAVLLEARDRGIILWTLHYGDEVRDQSAYFEKLGKAKADAKELALLKKVIEEKSTSWSPKLAEDPVQDRLLEMIEAKKKGRKAKPKKKVAGAAPQEAGSNVISITEALKKSLEAEKKKPAKK